MSIIDDIGSALSGVVHGAEDVASLAGKVWSSFKYVWWLLTHVALLLTDAWDWVVKGAEYIGVGMEHLASETGGLLWSLVAHTLPGITAWLYHHTIGWAWQEIEKLAVAVEKRVVGVIHWALKELDRLDHLLLGWVHHIIHWAESAVWWVEHRAETVWHLLTHPLVLAELLADHIVWPVIKWFLHQGAYIVVYLLKQAAHRGSEVEHLVEDILHDML